MDGFSFEKFGMSPKISAASGEAPAFLNESMLSNSSTQPTLYGDSGSSYLLRSVQENGWTKVGGRLLGDGVLCEAMLSPVFLDERHVCREVVLHVEGRFTRIEDGDVSRCHVEV